MANSIRKFIPKPVKKSLLTMTKVLNIAKVTLKSWRRRKVLGKHIQNYILEKFFDPNIGKEYGISKQTKTDLVKMFRLIPTKVQTATNWLYYVHMATVIFNISKKQKGDVIECGCWKGGSSAILSLICKEVGRKLIIADSFEGIPEDDDKHGHFYTHLSVLGYYEQGMYGGSMEEVKNNIGQYGKIKVCQFVKGFYKDSLKKFKKPLVFAFLDVDLRSSLEDSVKYIWSNLSDGSFIYTDDSCDMDVVKFWFDENWWKKNLKQKAPGYVGSGCGLPITPEYSSLGYTRKIKNAEKIFKRKNWFNG